MNFLQKMNNMINNLFSNKIFLYVMFFIAVVQTVFLIDSKRFNALFFLIALGIICRQFTVNIATILFISIIMTNIFITISPVFEGISGFRGTRSRYKKEDDSKDSVERFEKFKERLRNHKSKYSVLNENEEIEKDENVKNLESFSKLNKPNKQPIKTHIKGLPVSRNNHPSFINNSANISKYNEIKNRYKDLVSTIKEKTASIKALSKQIKV